MKLKLFCVCAFFAAAVSGFCQKMRVGFVSDNSAFQPNAAVLCGAESVARLYSARGMEIEILGRASNTADGQKRILSDLYLQGVENVILIPAGDVSDEIRRLSRKGVNVVLVGANCATADDTDGGALCRVSGSEKTLRKMLAEIIAKRGGADAKIACYFRGGGAPVNVSDSREILRLTGGAFSAEDFAELFGGRLLCADSFRFYSKYALENRVEIMRRDSFGEVFFSPELLADMSPIKHDSDRKFAVVVGALEMLEFYLASGQITDIVYDDYFGWGVFAMRALAEKRFENYAPQKRKEVLPIRVSKENPRAFAEDWRKWLK